VEQRLVPCISWNLSLTYRFPPSSPISPKQTMASPRSSEPAFHPIPVKIPESQRTAAGAEGTASIPRGSAILSQSESDADEADFGGRWRAQEDASVLYGKPQKKHKTRTLSHVRISTFFFPL
jgi:hypothetical protein